MSYSNIIDEYYYYYVRTENNILGEFWGQIW